MAEWRYVSGDWNIICDVCNAKIKASESKHRWDGFIVCPCCFENRHPQDFIRARQDKISVPFTRPIPAETFTSVPYVTGTYQGTPVGSYSVADVGQADMAQVGKLLNGVL